VHIKLSVYAGNGMVIAGRFRPGKLSFQAAQIQIAIQDKIPGTPVGCFDFLRHMGNPATSGQGDRALLRRQLAQQELKKTGFAGTIGTDNRDTLSGLHSEVDGF
jgi:hypothetical protein